MGRRTDAVLFLTSDFPPQSGGISRYSDGLARAFPKHFAKVVVLVERKTVVEGIGEGYSRVVQVPVGSSYLFRVLRLLYWALKLTRAEGIDRVMVSTWSPCGVVAWLLSYFRDLDYYVGAHGMDILEPRKSRKFTFLMQKTLSRATRVFPVSGFTGKKVEAMGIDPEKIVVIPNGVDTARFKAVEDVSSISRRHQLEDRRVILTVGRLVKRKGHDLVVEAMRVLARRYDDLVYLVVGEGPEKERLQGLVRSYSLTDRVRFAGFIPDSEIPKYYRLCDFFVMPVRELTEAGDVEGFGIVFLEANACGKPVIGTRSGGVEDAILENRTGLLIQPENIGQLVDAVSKLLDNRGLCQSLGNNGRERVFTQLTWEQSVRSMVREMDLTVTPSASLPE